MAEAVNEFVAEAATRGLVSPTVEGPEKLPESIAREISSLLLSQDLFRTETTDNRREAVKQARAAVHESLEDWKKWMKLTYREGERKGKAHTQQSLYNLLRQISLMFEREQGELGTEHADTTAKEESHFSEEEAAPPPPIHTVPVKVKKERRRSNSPKPSHPVQTNPAKAPDVVAAKPSPMIYVDLQAIIQDMNVKK